MPITLYDATVLSFLQTLDGVSRFLDRGLTHCQENGIDLDEIVETRLFPDMNPFRFQVQSVAHHSKGAIEGVYAELFLPPPRIGRLGYTELQALVEDARRALQELTPEAVNAFEGRDVTFRIGERSLAFRAEDFLLSFSMPNLNFHATTAYDILRSKGVPLGKRDYLGRLRTKPL